MTSTYEVRPGRWNRPRLSHQRSLSAAVVVAGVLAAVYLRWTPLVPDLAAQVARANVVHTDGVTTWWTGWFGGLSLPSYSIFVPFTMALFGVRIVGLTAVAVSSVATTILCRDALRPRAGAIAFAVSAFADLLVGRVTFVVGLAFAAWALVALRARRPAITLPLMLVTYFASPLAGLFLGMIVLAVSVVDSRRRWLSASAAATLLFVAGAMALMFPGTGTMPFTVLDSLPAALCGMGVLILCRQRLVRAATAFVLAGFPLFFLIPGAVGSNITRLAWVAAAPIVIAVAPAPRKLLTVTVAALAIWPAYDLAAEFHSATNPSAQAAFYNPVHTYLRDQQAQATGTAIGQRVEVVDTVNHWGSVYLSGLSLARGWDRQADHAYNPIFYGTGALDSSSYRRWLDDLAVGWVAVPTAPLDYASEREAKLIADRPDYLKLTWTSPHWQVFRVVDAAPLIRGAQVRSVTTSGVILTTSTAAVVDIKVRWSPYLVTRDPSTGLIVTTCITDANGWVRMRVTRAETLQLGSQFDPTARLTTTGTDCATASSGAMADK